MSRDHLPGTVYALAAAFLAGYAVRPPASVKAVFADVPPASAADTLPDWAAFELADLRTERAQTGRPYLRFLDVPTVSMGLYELEAGATDDQQPHARDEVYVVMSGSGVLSVAGADTPVGPGSVVFVAAQVDHRFHSIDNRLSVLVLFAAESD